MPIQIYKCSIKGCPKESIDYDEIKKHETEHKKEMEKPFEVAFYDYFDMEWCEVSRHATLKEAKEVCDKKQDELNVNNIECGEHYAVWQKLGNGQYRNVYTGHNDQKRLLEKKIERDKNELEYLEKQGDKNYFKITS